MIAQLDKLYIRFRPWKLWSRLISYALFEGRPLTTRGRWINKLVFMLFAIEKRLPKFRSVNKPIFIVGTGRSGTTILGVVLSMHRQVGFLNEPKALWHAIYPEEDLIGSYSRGNANYRLVSEDATEQIMKFGRNLFSAYLTATFSKRVVDKYPELIFRIPFVRSIFPDAKFLFLVRNGWDTCHSIEKWSERLGGQYHGECHDWWGASRRKWNLLVEQVASGNADIAPHLNVIKEWTNQADMAALEWIVTMREGLRLEKEYPDDILRVTHEELCASPRSVLATISNFAELPVDKVFLDYAMSTLKPVVTKPDFALPKEIEQAFCDTMIVLGYDI